MGKSIVIIRQLASDSFDNKGTVNFVSLDQEHRVQSVLPQQVGGTLRIWKQEVFVRVSLQVRLQSFWLSMRKCFKLVANRGYGKKGWIHYIFAILKNK